MPLKDRNNGRNLTENKRNVWKRISNSLWNELKKGRQNKNGLKRND